MYTIYADGQLVYAPTLASEGYAAVDPQVVVELNRAGSAQFTLPPDNVMYDRIRKLKSVVTVYDGEEEIFRGRVLHDEKDFYNRKDIYCEGELSFLLDSVVRPYSYKGGVAALFKQYVDGHNSQVDEWKRFRVGEVTVTDPNDYIVRSSSGYPDSLSEMDEKLVGLMGGYLRPRLSEGTRYLDYVAEYGGISDQVIEFGTNLLDLSEYITAEDVCTVLIPLGASQQDAGGNTTGRLTVSSVNGGKDYIEDSRAISLFGRITKVQEWDDVTVASNLLKKGEQRLAEGIEMAVSLTVSAVDLHLLDVDAGRIRPGDYVRVVSLPHGIDRYFLCSKISYDLVNPQNTEFTLGAAFSSLTDRQAGQQKTVKSTAAVIQSVQNSVGKASSAIEKVEQAVMQFSENFVSNGTFEGYQQETGRKYALKEEIPARVSELENDAGYLTVEEAEKGYARASAFEELSGRVEALERSGG